MLPKGIDPDASFLLRGCYQREFLLVCNQLEFKGLVAKILVLMYIINALNDYELLFRILMFELYSRMLSVTNMHRSGLRTEEEESLKQLIFAPALGFLEEPAHGDTRT